MRYDVFGPDPDGVGGQPRPLLRTVKYVYQITGNVSDIMVKDHYVNSTLTPGPQENYQWVWHLGLYYNLQGQVFRAVWDRWKEPVPQQVTNHQARFMRQFVYDSPTELVQVRSFKLSDNNSGTFEVKAFQQEVQPTRWLEYVAGQPAGEFEMRTTTAGWDDLQIADTREHASGLGRFATRTLGAGGEVSYPHGDLVGSTMMRVNAAGQAATAVAYTAFGEPISAGVPGVPNVQGDADWAAVGSIYRYCGEWNYQTGSLPAAVPDFDAYEYPVADDLLGLRATNPTLPPIILTHVGSRWYDASIGRFVQRDPIGLGGGVNLYAYVDNEPTGAVDPQGTTSMRPVPGGGFPGPGDLGGLVERLIIEMWILGEQRGPANVPGIIARIQRLRVLIDEVLIRAGMTGRWMNFIGICVGFSYLAAAAAEASSPFIDPLQQGGADRNRKRMGGFDPSDPIGPSGFEWP